MGIEGFNTALAATTASPVLDFDGTSLVPLEPDAEGAVVPFSTPSAIVDMILFVAKI